MDFAYEPGWFCGYPALLERELLEALYRLIGYGETGLYSQLNERWDSVQQAVCLYSEYLQAL